MEAGSWFHPWLWPELGEQGWTLCPAPRQSFPEGSYGPGPAFLETTGAALGSLTAALCSAYYKIFGSRTGTMVHPGFHGLPCLWDDEAGG